MRHLTEFFPKRCIIIDLINLFVVKYLISGLIASDGADNFSATLVHETNIFTQLTPYNILQQVLLMDATVSPFAVKIRGRGRS